MTKTKEILLKTSPSAAELEQIKEVENLVKQFTAQSVTDASAITEEQSNYILKNLIPELVVKSVNPDSSSSEEKIAAIESLLSCFVDLLTAMVQKKRVDESFLLMDKLSNVFNFKKTLFTKFRQVEATEEEKNDGKKSDTIDLSSFFRSEQEWRLGLHIGQEIDILKQDEKRRLQMWTTGVITDVKDRAGRDISKDGTEYKKDD